MKYLHTMIRATDLEASLHFYCNILGLVEVSRKDYTEARFTLVLLAADEDANNTDAPLIEITYNWDREEYSEGGNFGHLAFNFYKNQLVWRIKSG